MQAHGVSLRRQPSHRGRVLRTRAMRVEEYRGDPEPREWPPPVEPSDAAGGCQPQALAQPPEQSRVGRRIERLPTPFELE